MKQVFIEKAAGAFLILSELIVIIPKILSVPEALESASSWAAPDDGTLWFIGLLSLEIIWLSARFALGLSLLLQRPLKPWLFYLLLLILGSSGLTGLIISVALMIMRFWYGRLYSVKT